MWISSPFTGDYLEALIVRLGGSLRLGLVSSPKLSFRFEAQCTTATEILGKNFYFCLVY